MGVALAKVGDKGSITREKDTDEAGKQWEEAEEKDIESGIGRGRGNGNGNCRCSGSIGKV